MNIHMKTHSYKRAEFKCEECEFCGETELTMDMLLGKMHQENFECGLCGFEALDLEKFKLHLFTCEIFVCKSCEGRCKTILYIKEHLLDGKHRICNDKYYKVLHAKQGRGNREKVTVKEYWKEELCPPKQKKKNHY